MAKGDKRKGDAKADAPKGGARKGRRAKPRAKAPKSPKRGIFSRLFGWLFRFFFRLGMRIAAVVLLILACSVGYYYVSLPPVDELFDARARGSVTLMDRHGVRAHVVGYPKLDDVFNGVLSREVARERLGVSPQKKAEAA